MHADDAVPSWWERAAGVQIPQLTTSARYYWLHLSLDHPLQAVAACDWRQAPRCKVGEGRESRPCRFRCEATKTLLIHTTQDSRPSNDARFSSPR